MHVAAVLGALSACGDPGPDDETLILRAAIDGVLGTPEASTPATAYPMADVAVHGRFLRTRDGVRMYPGVGDEAFEPAPEALAKAVALVPALRLCEEMDACIQHPSESRVLLLTRPVVEGGRAAVYVLDQEGRYLEEYLVTVARVGSTWLPVSTRLTNWEH